MKEIKGLIKKDLFNLISYKRTLMIMVFMIFIFSIFSPSIITYMPIIIVTILGMCMLATFSYDELSKSDKYILAMPISKKEIVAEKYILAIISLIVSGIIGFFLTILIIAVNNYLAPGNYINIDYNNLLTTSISGIFGVALIQSIQIPSIYKWGAEKGRIEMFILIFGIILLITGAIYFVSKIGLDINLEQLLESIKNYGIVILAIFTVIMYYISFKISYKIYSKKDI